MAKFEYNGPFSVELIEGKETSFIKGQVYELPHDSKRVKTLVNVGYLTPIQQKENISKTKKGS